MRLTDENPMRMVLGVVLVFEAVVFGLAIPGMVIVSGRDVVTASVFCGAAAVLALAASATLRRGIGYPLGWATQVAGLALGLGTPYMYVLGGIFVALWVVAFGLGKRLEDR